MLKSVEYHMAGGYVRVTIGDVDTHIHIEMADVVVVTKACDNVQIGNLLSLCDKAIKTYLPVEMTATTTTGYIIIALETNTCSDRSTVDVVTLRR